MNQIQIIQWQDKYADDFRRLSLEWLEKYLRVEPADIEILEHPRETVVDQGGMIFFASDEDEPVGTVAMIRMDESTFELAKLGVTEKYKGNHISDRLMDAAIAYGRQNQGKKIVLYSSSRLIPALELYKKYGFKDVPVTEAEYEEADVKMELEILNEHS